MELDKIFSQVIWRPGMSDNNWWGWSAVALYYVIALLSISRVWHTVYRLPKAHIDRDNYFYAELAILFFGLGIARQIGALRWLTNAGRAIAWEQGWYMHRTLPQQQIIQIISYGSILLFLLLVWLNRQTIWRHGLVLLGVVTLLGYLAIHAVSLHSVDYMLNSRHIGGLPLGPSIEVGTLVFVGAALLLPLVFRHFMLSSE